jgi:hypothetical protein
MRAVVLSFSARIDGKKECFGGAREWHLILPNAVQHIAFGFVQ